MLRKVNMMNRLAIKKIAIVGNNQEGVQRSAVAQVNKDLEIGVHQVFFVVEDDMVKTR